MTETTPSRDLEDGQKHKLLARNALHLGLGQVATIVLGIFTTAILGRYLGASDFGLYFTVMTVAGYVFIIVDWGQSRYVIRETAKERSDEAQLIGSSILLRTIGTVFAAFAAAGITLVSGFDRIVVLLAPIFVLIAFPSVISLPLGYVFRGRDRPDLEVIPAVTGKAFNLAAIFTVLSLGGGLIAAVLAQAAGSISNMLGCIYFTRKVQFRVAAPTAKTINELLYAGVAIALFDLAVALQPVIDVFLLSFFTGPEVVGWYGAARTILGTIIAPATILSMATYPELSRASSSTPDLHVLIQSTGRLMLLASALGASSLYVFSDFIVTIIFGSGDFSKAAQILRVASLILPIVFLDFLLGTAANAVGKTKELAKAKFITMAIGVAIGWLTIEAFQEEYGNGALALIIAFGVSEIFMLAFLVIMMPRGSVSRGTAENLVKAYFVTIVVLFVFWALPAINIFLVIPGFVSLFAALTLTTGLLRKADLKFTIDFIQNREMLIRKSC